MFRKEKSFFFLNFHCILTKQLVPLHENFNSPVFVSVDLLLKARTLPQLYL